MPALIAGMLLIGIPVVLLLLREYISSNQEKKLIVATYILKVVLAFSAGSAIVWLINVTPASLFLMNFNGNSTHLAVGGEFRYLISYNLDSILLIILNNANTDRRIDLYHIDYG